jgi:Bardet-Biedl syndrome 2 protein
LVTVGKFDGKHPSLAFATASDNILIHSPHQRNTDNEHEVRQLSVNRTISALTSGNMNINSPSDTTDDTKDVKTKDNNNRDVLLVGTETNLLAYDVENNSDIFYKDVSDGVNSLVYGMVPTIKSPLAIVGGNCSIQGFDREGNEAFWTVAGDNVTALAFRDSEGDGNNELLVGSEDFEIRIFQQEEVVHQATEADVVTGLTHLHKTFFGFSLASGAIGVYNNANRVWHAKSKHKAVSITSFDLDQDGVPELITGWSNGRVEVRKIDDGKLIYKDRFPNPIAHLCVADYRMDNRYGLL